MGVMAPEGNEVEELADQLRDKGSGVSLEELTA